MIRAAWQAQAAVYGAGYTYDSPNRFVTVLLGQVICGDSAHVNAATFMGVLEEVTTSSPITGAGSPRASTARSPTC